MEKLGLNEIREKYLAFFESKGHLRMPSFPLVPQKDATLLLINAGMAPLKPYFTGQEVPPSNRVTTCQKCIRTPDIERVGITARHGTFFEMLGNFSFGDYFKKEATAWAWEFVTKVMEMPADRLWVSIYLDDDEAYDIWTKDVGVSQDRMVRLGKEDNFWEIGTGPCGPCSEIYFDRGEDKGCGSPDCAVGCDCDRFVEFWNLVFTQFDKDKDGNYNRLAKPNIDTGMGLERIAAIMQGENSLFLVDTVKNVLSHVCRLSAKEYGKQDKEDISIRIITDHIRGTVFLVSDGVVPSNEGRGYVLRRLLRRAARHGKLLGIHGVFLAKLADTVIDNTKGAYPELEQNREYIKKVIRIEEERFIETVDQGLQMLGQYAEEMKKNGQTVLGGEIAFKLYDTYGFPIDLTKEILFDCGMTMDEQGYRDRMEQQRTRARNARVGDGDVAWAEDTTSDPIRDVKSEFVGYDASQAQAKITHLLVDGMLADSAGCDMEVGIITDKTPFYGESGGQMGDSGTMRTQSASVVVKNTKKLSEDRILHIAQIESGTIAVGDVVNAQVDTDLRDATSRNHSATHLLHSALRQVLGSHVNQAGSFVSPDRLRFDFAHFEAVSKEQLAKVEEIVNAKILEAMPVETKVMDKEEAKSTGAQALFGEKYGAKVRVVHMGDYSSELCGGTHIASTAQIGLFKIISESGVAAGTRRIEAVTGGGVLAYMKHTRQILEDVAKTFKVGNMEELPLKAQAFAEELKESGRVIEQLKNKLAGGAADALLSGAKQVKGVVLIAETLENTTVDEMRIMGDKFKEQISGALVVVLASTSEGKLSFVAMTNAQAAAMGAHAGNIIKKITPIADGSGGGRPDSAQGGGKAPHKMGEALTAVEAVLAEQIK